MLVDLVKTYSKQTYVAKNGKEYPYQNYALKLPSGRLIQVKPCFSTDYEKLDACSTLIDRD